MCQECYTVDNALASLCRELLLCELIGMYQSYVGFKESSWKSFMLVVESHHENIKLVLNNVVDAAAIDSNVFRFWLEEHPQYKEELHVLCSWGPWPIQPIALNTRIAGLSRSFLWLKLIFIL